jgi:hypothetical protein
LTAFSTFQTARGRFGAECQSQTGRAAIGLKADRGRLFVAVSRPARPERPAGCAVGGENGPAGGQSVANGDGILLDGKTLYVVQNQLNVVAKIRLVASLRSGRVVRQISNPASTSRRPRQITGAASTW